VCTREVATVATPDTLPRWLEYARIEGALANLRYHKDTILAYNVLHDHHLDSTQRHTMGMSWGRFLKLSWEVSGATDFCTAEMATGHRFIQIITLELVLSRQGG
jgi:hypothetical protein